MLQKILNNKLIVVQFILLAGLLILIRAYEDQLFYDPLLDFFKKDFTKLRLPNFKSSYLFFGLLFRYSLNTIVSLGIIYVFFKDVSMIQFSLLLYVILFIVLSLVFFSIVYIDEGNNWLLFYVRRFLIQPIFILLFIPGFYYQKLQK